MTLPEPCDAFAHKWVEEYYGYRCLLCDTFVPFGCEPWIDPDDFYPAPDYEPPARPAEE